MKYAVFFLYRLWRYELYKQRISFSSKFFPAVILHARCGPGNEIRWASRGFQWTDEDVARKLLALQKGITATESPLNVRFYSGRIGALSSVKSPQEVKKTTRIYMKTLKLEEKVRGRETYPICNNTVHHHVYIEIYKHSRERRCIEIDREGRK